MIIDSYSQYPSEQVAALQAFITRSGKGLFVAGHAWYWSYSHPNANIYTDLAVNKVLWPLGMALTTNLQVGFKPAPSTPPADWLYLNSFYSAAKLVLAKEGDAFSQVESYTSANIGLNLLISTLPARADSSRSGLDAVWQVLDSARSSTGPAVGPNKPLNWRDGYPGDVLDVMLDAWSVRRGDITSLRRSRSAGLYPGEPPAGTTTSTVTVRVIGKNVIPFTRLPYADEPAWRSTGLYAPPGALVTVTAASTSAVGKGLQIQIGAHTDDLTFKETWARVPVAVSRFLLDSKTMTIGSALGGLIFVLVPRGSQLGEVTVTFSNVIRAPYYKLGSTSKTSWVNTVRNYPGPWAELDSGKLVIMVPSKAIRALADPGPVLKIWNQVMDSMAYLANISTSRPRSERFLVDADISAGWMHAGYPIMAYDVPAVHKELLDAKQLKTRGAWGPFHELGHNHQWEEMLFNGGTVESSVNLFTVHALESLKVPMGSYENDVSPSARAAIRAEYLANGANWERDWDVWVALDTYLQLKDGFGWDFYKRLYGAYQQLPYPLGGNLVQKWIEMTSRVSGRNLVPFYEAWGFPIAQETRNLVANLGLPAWAEDPMN